ncbi:MAG: hypothetical protein N2110_09000 [Flavobacteriales bacterium]|nr:hypothetical protein [Flavobacteriales bacterium]MCX7769139.1 hypothetical protein [Flavobacteriales bacterium]MDW8410159.1 hypothetical protein [Flavobacteriales bacterium]
MEHRQDQGIFGLVLLAKPLPCKIRRWAILQVPRELRPSGMTFKKLTHHCGPERP